jgi:hypothetical protein
VWCGRHASPGSGENASLFWREYLQAIVALPEMMLVIARDREPACAFGASTTAN